MCSVGSALKGAGVGIVALAGLPAAAVADIQLATFTFSELSASYNSESRQFAAVSSMSGSLLTTGDVSRLDGPGGTAQYGPGIAPGLVDISISVGTPVGSAAPGAGEFRILDADGDVFHGLIDGAWTTRGFGSVFFEGLLSGVGFIDNGTLDGMFNGPNGGSFSMDLPGSGPYDGAFVELQIVSGGFFTTSYDGVSSLASGTIVPAPGAIAVLAAAGLIGRRRR